MNKKVEKVSIYTIEEQELLYTLCDIYTMMHQGNRTIVDGPLSKEEGKKIAEEILSKLKEKHPELAEKIITENENTMKLIKEK